MTHFIHPQVRFETIGSFSRIAHPCGTGGRRLCLALLVLVMAFLALLPRPARADAAAEQQVHAIKDHAAECTWVLGSEKVPGKDLSAKGYRFEITALIWDGKRADFYLDLTVPKKGSGGAETVTKWRYSGNWNVAKEGDAWKVTDALETIVAQHPKPSRPMRQILRLPF